MASTPVEQAGLFEILYNCRAMRRLKPDPVPDDLLRRLIDAAHQAPSGSNAQSARWLVVRDPAVRAGLAALNRAAVEAYLGPDSPRPAALPHHDPAKRERQRQAVLWQAEHMHELPALVIACLETARRAETFVAGLGAGGSVWPGVQNLLLAARALGLGAAPTTLGLQNRPAVRALLQLPETVEPVCLIPVGYPRGRFGPVTRRPLDEVLHWDRWTAPAR